MGGNGCTCEHVCVCLCMGTIGDTEEDAELVLGGRELLDLAEVQKANREALQLILTQIDLA